MIQQTLPDCSLEHFGEFARTNHSMGLYPDQEPIARNEPEVTGPAISTPKDIDPGATPADWTRTRHKTKVSKGRVFGDRQKRLEARRAKW